jgi:hypothetical protein
MFAQGIITILLILAALYGVWRFFLLPLTENDEEETEH